MIFVPASATLAEVLVDAVVNLVLVSLLSAVIVVCCLFVIYVVVSAPSTLSALVAFVSQEKSVKTVEDVDDEEPMAIELMEADEEVSSDEEEDEDDDIVMTHTVFDLDAPEQAKAETADKVESAAEAKTKPRKSWFRRLGSTAKRCFRIRKRETKSRPQVQKESSKPANVTVVASCAPVPEQTRPGKRVSFGVVQVQEYGVVLGDNPCCKDGFPLSLDWAHTEAKEYSLDSFAQAKATWAPRRGLDANGRMHRIAAVAGIPLADLQKEERTRRRKADKEAYEAVMSSNLSVDEADEADAVEVSVSGKSLGAFQF